MRKKRAGKWERKIERLNAFNMVWVASGGGVDVILPARNCQLFEKILVAFVGSYRLNLNFRGGDDGSEENTNSLLEASSECQGYGKLSVLDQDY